MICRATRRDFRDFFSRKWFLCTGEKVNWNRSDLFRVLTEDIPWLNGNNERPLMEEDPGNIASAMIKDQHDGKESNGSKSGFNGRLENLLSLFKEYHGDNDRYSGMNMDNLERKNYLFLERCYQSDVCEEERINYFSIMLCGSARKYYFDTLKAKRLDLKGFVDEMKARLNKIERTRTLMCEWDSLNLSYVMAKRTEKDPSECLGSLLSRPQDIKFSLHFKYRNDKIMRNKLFNSVKDVE